MSIGISIYDVATGVFTGVTMTLPDDVLRGLALPDGQAWVAGAHNHTSRRVDIDTGEVVPYQPPAPPDDEWRTWTWDEAAWAWHPVPTTAALARDARARRDALIAASDWTESDGAQTRLGPARATAYALYRGALFALPEQPGFPATITWPEEPA